MFAAPAEPWFAGQFEIAAAALRCEVVRAAQ
jgi:hypothetical protein